MSETKTGGQTTKTGGQTTKTGGQTTKTSGSSTGEVEMGTRSWPQTTKTGGQTTKTNVLGRFKVKTPGGVEISITATRVTIMENGALVLEQADAPNLFAAGQWVSALFVQES